MIVAILDRLIFAAAIGVLLLIGAVVASAAPPPNADPALRPWFDSLVANNGTHCCGPEVDCRATGARIVKDHWQALLDPAIWPSAVGAGVTKPTWIDIPPTAILHRNDNPIGEAVLCWHRWAMDAGVGLSSAVLCFVPPAES
ncbi:MAG TPA: hypothetical protein VFA22_07125 [Stellaceae bacterium]|nr:hypothetical protein [Stellaceae bacterium]